MFDAIARPFGMLLMFLYDLVNNYAAALLLIAVVIKVILLPFQMKGKRGQLRQARLQPKVSELQKKHSANKQKLNEEMAKLYKEEGINPASGCLWSFIQMPIMIALFYAIRQPLTLMMGVRSELLERGGIILNTLQEIGASIPDEILDGFYSEVHIAQAISDHWEAFRNLGVEGLQYISFNFGIVNLAETPQWQVWNFPWDNGAALLPILLLFMFPIMSSGAQFVSMAIMRKMNVSGTPEAASGTMGTVLKFMPLMSLWFGFILPAALSFYWTIGTVLQIGQDIWLTKKYTKILDEEDAVKDVARKAKEAEIEAKREETERKKAEGLIEQNTNTSKRKKKKSNKQGQLEKAAEWEKKNTPVVAADEKYEPSREGNRRYARGRAYDPDRFPNVTDGDADESTEETEVIDVVDEDQASDVYGYEVDDFDEDFEDDDDEDDEDFEDENDEDDEDFKDEDDVDDSDDDGDDSDEDLEDDDDDEDFEDDDDDTSAPSSEKFETKRFD
jgi:YidC/Oxa1 family membrane protein insertase